MSGSPEGRISISDRWITILNVTRSVHTSITGRTVFASVCRHGTAALLMIRKICCDVQKAYTITSNGVRGKPELCEFGLGQTLYTYTRLG